MGKGREGKKGSSAVEGNFGNFRCICPHTPYLAATLAGHFASILHIDKQHPASPLEEEGASWGRSLLCCHTIQQPPRIELLAGEA